MLEESNAACDSRPEVNTDAFEARDFLLFPFRMQTLHDVHTRRYLVQSGAVSSGALSVVVGEVLCFASSVDGCSLDVIVSHPVHLLG